MNTPRVTRELILDTAQRVVEERGVSALSMRRLAAELDIAVTAIYWHVGNRETLVAQLVDRVIGRLGDIAATGDTPAERVIAVGTALRRLIHAHPHVIALVYEHGRTALMMLPAERVLAREATAVGLPPAQAATVIRGVLHHVVGFVLLERAVQHSPAQHPTATELWTHADEIGVSPQVAAELALPPDQDHLFDQTLKALVHALLTPQT